MKRKLTIALLFTMLVTLSSCLQNNGHIGDWYGMWKLTEMKVDGVPDTTYGGNIFWSFQTNIFQMKRVSADGNYDNRWGSWSEDDGKLLLSFNYRADDSSTPGTGTYAPLPETYLQADAVNTLEILKKPGSKMELSYTIADGKRITYTLTRW